MDPTGYTQRSQRPSTSSYGRPLAIFLTLLAILSPLYIDSEEEAEPEEEGGIEFATLLPLILFFLVMAVLISCYLDQRLTSFDPYWIHRVGGSSGGIVIILTVLALVLKCKAVSS